LRRFARFAALDWSGAKGPRQKGIALAVCPAGDAPPALIAPPGGWSREAILEWLIARAEERADMIIGIDFSPSLPFDPDGGFLPGWDEVPRGARGLWRFVDACCAEEPHLGANDFVDHIRASAYFRRSHGRVGERFGRANGRLRIVEKHCRDERLGPAQSCFNLVGAAQVGKSSLTGMRLLNRLAGRVPIWPFDEPPDEGPLIVEIYTTIAARAAGVAKGSKIRNGFDLDAALDRLESGPHIPLARYNDHATDAILSAAWLRRAADRPALWRALHQPGRADLANTEGWTFGVP